MSKSEVVRRLISHLKGKKFESNKISKDNKCYCLHYIMDFLFCDKETAKNILKNDILSRLGVEF